MPKKKPENHEGETEPAGPLGADPPAANGAPKKGTARRKSPTQSAKKEATGHANEASEPHGAEWEAATAPKRHGPLGRLVYGATYALSYGVVLPVMLLAHAMPRDSALVHGLMDGASAARDTVEGMWGDPASTALDGLGHPLAALPA